MSRANLRESVLWMVAGGDHHNQVRQEMADSRIRRP